MKIHAHIIYHGTGMAVVDRRYRVLCTLSNTNDNSFNSPRGALQKYSFIQMPYDVHQIVLAHTAASVVVDYLEIHRYLERDDQGEVYYIYIPVIARYEFNLEERRTGNPKMSAIFTRELDPESKKHSDWQSFSTEQQQKYENEVKKRAEYKDFSAVMVKKPKNNASTKSFFYFMDTKGKVTASTSWSGISPEPLSQVRRELKTKFHIHLRDMV